MGAPSASGVNVNEQSALHMVAVWACVRVIAETVGSLPFPVYRRMGRGRERVYDHQVYRLLNRQPNPETTPMVFREAITAHALTWGMGYIYVVRHPYTGEAESLWMLLPDRTFPVRSQKDRSLSYQTTLPDGRQTLLPSRDVVPIVGLGYDGVTGYSPIRMGMEAIGAGLAAEEFANRFYSQGAHIGGIVEIPGRLNESAQERLSESIKETHQGLGRSHLMMLLEEGVKYHQIGIPPDEAQFLETRKFQAEEIARLYRVPPHKIGLMDRSTHSNIEQQAIEWSTDTILPWCRRWEQPVNIRLFDEREQRELYAEHNMDGIMRGDIKSRYEAYSVGRQWGWLSANDVREKENMNPIDGGDMYMVPLNMIPSSGLPETLKGGEGTGEERTYGRLFEERSLASQHRLMDAWRGVVTDAAGRVIRREVADIRRAIKRHTEERSLSDFRRWLRDFYEQAPEWIRSTMMPTIASYAEAVMGEMQTQMELPEDHAERLQGFVAKYGDGMSVRHAATQRRTIERILDEEDETVFERVAERLDEWEDHRYLIFGRNETISIVGGVSRLAFTMTGRGATWRANANACPYCQELDGMSVNADSPFVPGGSSLDPVGGTGPMKIHGRVSHPPLHDGCECVIVPN